MSYTSYKISDIGEVVGGSTPSTKDLNNYCKHGVPWITPYDLSNHNSRYISRGERDISLAGASSISAKMLPAGSVLFTSRAPIGYVAIAKNELCTNQGFKSIIPNDKVASDFLYYLLKSTATNIASYGSGATFKEIPGSVMRNITLPIPSMKTQHKIAGVLSALDNKIELNDKINKKLNELARLIYDYWFVQFDFPDEDGHPYRVSGGKMVYNDLLKREIPEGWKAVKMSNIARITSGYPFKSDIYTASGKYRIITIKNVKDGFIDSSNCDHIILLPDNLPYECRLQIGDILLSLTGNVGRTGRVFEDNLLLNQRVGKVVCEDETNKAYIYMILTSEAIKKSLEQLSNGSSQANLSPIQATKFAIPLPPRDIIDKFNSSIKPILEMDIINRRESQQLAQLRDWLLPMLMSGQVVVK